VANFTYNASENYIGSWHRAMNSFSIFAEYGNPFIRAFYSAGKWPIFSPFERACIFMITLSATCLITALWIDAVVITETMVWFAGSEWNVTALKMALQIELCVVMPIDMMVESVFEKYRRFRSPKLSILVTNSDDELERLQVNTNDLSRAQKTHVRILVVFACVLMGVVFFLFTFVKLAALSASEVELWVEVVCGEITEEFTTIHPIFCIVSTLLGTLFDSEIDWHEWMPYNAKKVPAVMKRLEKYVAEGNSDTDSC